MQRRKLQEVSTNGNLPVITSYIYRYWSNQKIQVKTIELWFLAVTETASLRFADVNSTILYNWVAALKETGHSYLQQLKTACTDGQSGYNSRADISPLSRNRQTWPTFDAKPILQTARDPLLPLLWTVSHSSVGGCRRKLPPALYVNRNIFKSYTSEVNPLFESFVASVHVTKCSLIINSTFRDMSRS